MVDGHQLVIFTELIPSNNRPDRVDGTAAVLQMLNKLMCRSCAVKQKHIEYEAPINNNNEMSN